MRTNGKWSRSFPWPPSGKLVTLACILAFAAGQAMADDVATDDGLTLQVAPSGAVISCRIDGRELLHSGRRGGTFVADVSTPPGPDQELLTNAGLEQTEEGQPVGWNTGPEWSPDHEITHSGNTAMRVHVPGTEKRSTSELSQDVVVRPNTPYRVSMWVRSGGAVANLYVQQFDAAGAMHPDWPQLTTGHARRQSDWFLLTRSFTTSPVCRTVRVRTNLWKQTGTAWIDDVSLVCLDDDCVSPQEPALGTVAQTESGLTQHSRPPNSGLQVTTTYTTRKNMIVVDGEVRDTSGRDCAVTVSFRLPIDATGWTWFDDTQNQQGIEEGIRYGAARLMGGDGRRTVALYPFAAMGDSRSALAIAIPMDMPRAFRICFDSELGYFVNYEFGLSQATAKFPGRAAYRFFIYRIDPAWGFRSAADRYFSAHPQYFTKRLARQGSIGSLHEPEQHTSPDYPFAAYVDFNWHRRKTLPAYRRELANGLQYAEFIGWWGWALGIKPDEAATQPSPEEALTRVRELATQDPPQKVAQCILNCIPHGRDGKPQLHRNYVPKWGGYNYLCNPDPEIEGVGGKVNRYTLTYEREVSRVDQYKLAGMRYDNPIVFAVDNFRREHFKWSDHPLAFDHVSRRPVLPLDFSSFECATSIADDMHAQGKIVGSNYTPVASPSDMFHVQSLDLIASETLWTWPSGAKLRLQRVLANQKTVAMCWQEAKKSWDRERVERELKHAMFYGTFYYFSTMGVDLYERWIPLTRRLANAGWMPVTHARCETLGPMVERFGSLAGKDLHFTLRNGTGEEKTAELLLDADGLGIGPTSTVGAWLMKDAATHIRAEMSPMGDQRAITVTVPPRDTVVLRVGTQTDVVLDHLFRVPEELQKAENYRQALEEEDVPPTCPDYTSLGTRTRALIDLLKASPRPPQGARADLQSLLVALTEPTFTSDARETAAWRAGLKKHSTAARNGIKYANAYLPKSVPPTRRR
ncbi:MAG: hypothetical protein HON70_22890 [Lentisphaerae bacterium]|nr:hypothetical protein [Lentisphaerota bacterium]